MGSMSSLVAEGSGVRGRAHGDSTSPYRNVVCGGSIASKSLPKKYGHKAYDEPLHSSGKARSGSFLVLEIDDRNAATIN